MSTVFQATNSITSLTADQYHDDPAEQPSLSASIAHLLCAASPAHAQAAHPRLNPMLQRRDETHFDIGTVAHAILLEGDDIVTVVDAPDWRTAAARQARDDARANGRIPLLAHKIAEVNEMLKAVRQQLDQHTATPPLFTDGKPEQTIIWEEDGVCCRSRVDWLRHDVTTIDDLKTTARSAHPDAYARTLFNVGGDIQAAFYIRGVEAVTGATPTFRWCVVETTPPFALSVVTPSEAILTIGRKKVDYAIGVWRRCLESGVWPGYPASVQVADLPPWEEARWLEREMRDAA